MSNQFPSLDDNSFEGHPRGWLQWKGTDVCMDVHCKCGQDFHIHGLFIYYVQCPKCKALYEVGGYVKLYEIDFTPDESVIGKDEELEEHFEMERWINHE